MRGDALATFPDQAFEAEVVVRRFLGRQALILNRPAAIRRVLVDNPGNYVRTAPTIRVLRPMFGRGLFLAAGQDWKAQRQMLAPAFAPRAVRILAGQVAADATRFVSELRREPVVHLPPRLQRLAIEIIGGAMFSLEMATFGGELAELIRYYARHLGRPAMLDFLLPLAVPSLRDLRRQRFRRRWTALIGRILAERRRLGPDSRRDLFDLLREGHGDASEEAVADQVATIVVAGHETTAAAMFWSLYLLALSPREQERVAAEAAQLDLSPDGAAEAVPRLVYTRAVVDEALRLYAPAFVIVRRALADDAADGIAIPAGSLVLIAPWVLHRHRRLWHEPDEFDPSRFLPGAPQPPRFAYMPFGAGPRTCIGAQFALTELVLVLATLVRAFRIELAEPRPARPFAIVTTQPADLPPFRLSPRIPARVRAGPRQTPRRSDRAA
jgi:cytochrome P450